MNGRVEDRAPVRASKFLSTKGGSADNRKAEKLQLSSQGTCSEHQMGRCFECNLRM